MPRTSKVFIICGYASGSVAGEGKKMPSVVHELVDVHVGEHGRRTLLRTDEVQRDEGKETDEHRPRQDLADRDPDWDGYCGGYRLRHGELLGLARPLRG